MKLNFIVKQLRRGAPDPAGTSRSKFIDVRCSELITLKNMISEDSVSQIRVTAIRNFQAALEKRYTDIECTSEILSNIRFVDVQSWPSGLAGLSSFCVKEMKVLIEYFTVPLTNARATTVDIQREFKLYYGTRMQELNRPTHEFWPWAYRVNSNKDKFKNFF